MKFWETITNNKLCRPGITWPGRYHEVESIHIHNCPICQAHHEYLVQVDRIAVKGRSEDTDIIMLRQRTRLIRFFTCQVYKKRFRGILTLFHSRKEIIRNIEVIRIKESSKKFT